MEMLIKTTTVQATTRKLKAKWSAEMASDLKSLYSNESNMFQWNADNYKELHSCDAEYWHCFMRDYDRTSMSTYVLHSWLNELKAMLTPGELAYVVYAKDQSRHEAFRRTIGRMVTVTGNTPQDEPWTLEVLGEDGLFFCHVFDLMKIQIDQTKPRVSHWDIDEGIMF